MILRGSRNPRRPHFQVHSVLMKRRAALSIVVCFMALSGCSQEKFSSLEEEFVYTTLSFSPVAASAAGLHEYRGKNFNQMLDDISTASFDSQRMFYRRFHDRLGKMQRNSLDPQDQTDYDIIQDQIALSLFELDTTQTYL